MEELTGEYRLSIYLEIVELSQGKIYIVISSLDNKIYVKKILESKNLHIYKKMQSLSIPNIPKIYELINLGDRLIVIEEYINGSSLKETLDISKTIPFDRAVKYTINLIDIIERLHSCDPPIIHKDINPSNIMINNDGVLKLIDFDISRTHSSDKNTDTDILGTHGYAAPEQFGFNQTDARTDIFSIGVTLNMMLVGEFPNIEIYKGEISKIISKCIELDPDKRYQNVNDLKNDLLKASRTEEKWKSPKVDTNLPGFRSKNIFLRIIAFLWYLLLIMISLGVFYKEPLSKDRIMDIVMVSFFFTITLLYGNYRGIKSKLPILRSEKYINQILGYIVYTVLLFIIFTIMIPS